MMEVKVVCHGGSLALSLPKDNCFKKGQHWLLIPSADGKSFTLVPKMKNPYTQDPGSKNMAEEWSDVDWREVE